MARAKLDAPEFRHITLRQADLYNVPIEAETADFITLHHVLHYLDEPVRAVREAARLLAPHGKLLIADFIAHERQELRDEHSHLWLGFSQEEISTMCLAAGLMPMLPTYIPSQSDTGLTAFIAVTHLR